jgi:DNA-binding response OmpR family regulator
MSAGRPADRVPTESLEDVLRVLVVTDNDPVREELEYGFPEPVEVKFARDSREAWQRLFDEGDQVTAVVVDLQTGAAGGFALASDMKAVRALAEVPVVILLERDQDRWLARQAGAAAALLKPVTASQVLAAIRHA